MSGFADQSIQHPQALKVVFALAGIFILLLVAVRLATLLSLVSSVLSGAAVVMVEPGAAGAVWIVVGVLLALLALLLPARLRKVVWLILGFAVLLLIAVSGNRAAPDGAGVTGSTLGHWLRGEGYVHCPGQDQIHRGLHGDTRTDAWARPDACAAPAAAAD